MRRFAVAWLTPLAWALVQAGLASAQQVQVEVGKGPHYTGMPIEIQLVGVGFEDDPAPEQNAPAPARGKLEFIGVQPSTSQSISIVNGRVTRTSEVKHAFRYRYVASEPGRVSLGPFTLTQSGVQRTSRPVNLRIAALEISDRLSVQLELPEEPVLIGQRVPVVIEFSLDAELQKQLHSYTLRVPLFDPVEGLRFVDEPEPSATTDVEVETSEGRLRLRGTAREEARDGNRSLVVRVTRTLIPLRSGRIEFEPASLIADEATRWQRDFFGGRRVTHVRKLRAVDRARALEVGAIPNEERPEIFAGAVGRGFSLEVSVDRSVVQVGDPITLTLTLRGEGNLESARLPPLSAEGLLDSARFRVPSGDAAGRIEGDAKRFEVVVRVQDESVSEIPALAYSWFDTPTQSFLTTHSRPIALSVRPAELVGAADVVSGARTQEDSAARDDTAAPTDPSGSQTAFTLSGADLAIERDVSRLVRGAGSGPSSWGLLGGVYLVPSLLLGGAWLDRRRRSVDPERIRLRRHLQTQERRIRAASSRPEREAAREIADALRQMLAQAPDARSIEIESLLGECDALIYAPDGASMESNDGIGERAARLAEQILKGAS